MSFARCFGLFFVCVYLGRPTTSSLQSCSQIEEKLSANGVCSESAMLPCRNICSGDVISGSNICRQTPYCCLVEGRCMLKTIESTNGNAEAAGIFTNEKRLSQTLYQTARALIQDGPNNLDNLQRRSLTERWTPFNKSEVPPVIQPRFLSSRSRDPTCLPFPFSCQLPHYSSTIEYQQPDINIPYCQRIPCRNNHYLEINQPLCLSVPGCAFDSTLAFYRQVFGQGFMPHVPVCHLAIRNPAFTGAVTDFILKYKQTSWNPIFNRCLLEQKKDEIFRNPPGCEMVLLLENFGHLGKQAGWSNITQRECHLIGACWLKSRCLYPVKEDGNSTIQLAEDLQGGKMAREFGEPQCAPISDLAPDMVDDYHKCLAAGCALDLDEELIRRSLMMMSQFVLPPKLYGRFRCMIQNGQVRPDNWKQVMNDLQVASATSVEKIMGSIPLARLDKDYAGINIKQMLQSNQLQLELVGSADDVRIPQLECGDDSQSLNNLPPLAPLPQTSGLLYCPYQPYHLPGFPRLAGRLDGCCDLPRCYLPRRLMNVGEALKSGIASYLTPWTSWSPCSATCGPGGRTRKRRCVGDGCHPAAAAAEMQQSQICPNQAACPRMSSWGAFSSCKRNCWKRRTRECLEGACVGAGNQLIQQLPCTVTQCRMKVKSVLPRPAWQRANFKNAG